MKTILRWCVANGYLPRRRWFYDLVRRHLMIRLGRDGMWVFDLGDQTQRRANEFRDWYEAMTR